MLDLKALQAQIRKFDWVIGALNYDEDLHFSSYYLRASTPQRTGSLYPGYELIIGFYENFTERYFLRRQECIQNAEILTSHALGNPTWLRHILDEIVRRSDALKFAFPPTISPALLSSASNDELLAMYEHHHRLHSELYTYARIPEALDRGVNYFTGYLRQYLESLDGSQSDLDGVFNQLTQPVTASVLSREILDFEKIVEAVRRDPQTRELILSFPQQARLLLPHDLLEQVRLHVRQWRYLDYHGYGARRVTDEISVMARLVSALGGSKRSDIGQKIGSGLIKNRNEKEALFEDLRMDAAHRSLFEMYPEIGAAKLYRRYAQLRNFYYLDMLLAEIANRLRIDEWTLRSALPEEISRALAGGTDSLREAQMRRAGCMYVLRDDEEVLFSGDQIYAIREQLETQSTRFRDRKMLKGIVASRGKVLGVCKIVIRGDAPAQKFQEGAILVSESTDPDLLKYISVAGGVLTQQGGVTAHAAIICREIGVPAIIGIEGLLDTLKDGDVVELDAFTGSVRLIESSDRPPTEILLDTKLLADSDHIGGKAANLARLTELAFSVPPYLLLKFDDTGSYLATANPSQRAVLGSWIWNRLGLIEDELVAIRSSCVEEDSDGGSLAGEFDSILDVPFNKAWEELANFVEKNRVGRRGYKYTGSIIIQQMIQGELGGVSLTADVTTDDTNVITFEMSAQGAREITSGLRTQSRLRIRKDTFDILDSTLALPLETKFGRQGLARLAKVTLDIERAFGCPVNIEWVKQGSTIFILQARPIVFRKWKPDES